MILLQLGVLLICIFIVARFSGIDSVVLGIIGLLILPLLNRLHPADRPFEFILIILGIVNAATLQAAGGADYLINTEDKILRLYGWNFSCGKQTLLYSRISTLHTAIHFDRTLTTKIGKYVLNHSFMLPGFVTTLLAVVAGLILQSILI